MTRLRTRLTAATTALALVLGSFAATPAAALSDDGEKALGWILGLGATALIINELDKGGSTRRVAPAPRSPGFDIRDERWDGRRDDRRDGRRDGRRDDRRLTVPASCLIAVRTHDGRREVVSGRCATEVVGRGRLPRSCAFELITDHGRRETVYGRNCLEDEGYRIGRR